MAGRVQKRAAERTGHYQPVTGEARVGQLRPVKRVNPDKKNWHARALAWFESLKTSGQADYFQDSDWAQAKIIADMLTYVYDVKFQRTAQMMDTISTMMSKLGTTEADRRQLLRLELEHPVELDESPGVKAEVAYLELIQGGAAA